MSSLLLYTLNQYEGAQFTADDAIQFVAKVCHGPIPNDLSKIDWRAHVPMHLLENWAKLTDDERVAIYVMGQSATFPFEVSESDVGPTMN